jgi:hypothetical protein
VSSVSRRNASFRAALASTDPPRFEPKPNVVDLSAVGDDREREADVTFHRFLDRSGEDLAIREIPGAVGVDPPPPVHRKAKIRCPPHARGPPVSPRASRSTAPARSTASSTPRPGRGVQLAGVQDEVGEGIGRKVGVHRVRSPLGTSSAPNGNDPSAARRIVASSNGARPC